MGIITEELKPTRVLLDNTEFVRAKSSQGPAKEVVFGSDSLALREKCVIYRNIRPGRKTVTIIPYKNIDTFCIQTRKLNLLLVAGIVLVLLAVGSGLWLFASPAFTQAFGLSRDFNPVPLQLKSFWEPSLFLICGLIFLLTHSIYHRVELMICTVSRDNQVRVSLSSKVADSVEQFVASLEIEMQKA